MNTLAPDPGSQPVGTGPWLSLTSSQLNSTLAPNQLGPDLAFN